MNSRADAAVPRPDRADIPGTSAMIAGILTPHACPARCGAQRLNVTAKSHRRRACPAIQASPRPAVQRRAGPPTGHTSLQRRRTFTAQQPLSYQFIVRRLSADSRRHRQSWLQSAPSGSCGSSNRVAPIRQRRYPTRVRLHQVPSGIAHCRRGAHKTGAYRDGELGIDGAHGVVRGGGLGDVAH